MAGRLSRSWKKYIGQNISLHINDKVYTGTLLEIINVGTDSTKDYEDSLLLCSNDQGVVTIYRIDLTGTGGWMILSQQILSQDVQNYVSYHKQEKDEEEEEDDDDDDDEKKVKKK